MQHTGVNCNTHVQKIHRNTETDPETGNYMGAQKIKIERQIYKTLKIQKKINAKHEINKHTGGLPVTMH